MTLPENTNYEAFAEFLKSECMHETVYTDSEGRTILVIGLLDAFTMAHRWGVRIVREEREACAKVCEKYESLGDGYMGDHFRECAAELRARGKV